MTNTSQPTTEDVAEKSSSGAPRIYMTPVTEHGYEVMVSMQSLSEKFERARKLINSLPFIEKDFVEPGENPLIGTTRVEDLQGIISDVFGLSLIINTEPFDMDRAVNGIAATVYVLTEAKGYQPVASMQRTLAQNAVIFDAAVDSYVLLAAESQAIVRAAAQVGLVRTEMNVETQAKLADQIEEERQAAEEKAAEEKAAEEKAAQEKATQEKATQEKAKKAQAQAERRRIAKEKKEAKARKDAEDKAAKEAEKTPISSSKLSQSEPSDGPSVSEMRDEITSYLAEAGLTQRSFINLNLYKGKGSIDGKPPVRRVSKLEPEDLAALHQFLPKNLRA